MAVGFPVKDDYVTGDVLTAANMNDLSGTVNLLDSAQYAAGKNKVINGDFLINQRSFSSTTANATFTVDRWQTALAGGTVTTSVQNFTPGAAPVAGYESKQFLQIVSTGQSASSDFASTRTYLESVRTLAGQTATLSFWAKATSGTPKIGATFEQRFGTGGSPSTEVLTVATAQTISTSWARYSFTVNIPSISGKTLGTNNNDYLGFFIFTSCGTGLTGYSTNVGLQNNTIGIWGVQLEAGSTSSDFQTATGTIQGELAACQRYYYRNSATNLNSSFATGLIATSTTNYYGMVPLPVQFRTAASSVDFSTIQAYDTGNTVQTVTAIAVSTNIQAANMAGIDVTVTGATTGRVAHLRANSSTSAYLGFSAEL